MVKALDLSGQSFGRVTVVEKTSKRDKKGNVIWHCVCSCGNKKLISTRRLKSNKNISCGCYRREKVRESVTNISKARIDNESSGIRNIYYLPTKVLACYRVMISRKGKNYSQFFPTLQEAERAKEYVLSRYKKGISNWNEKL